MPGELTSSVAEKSVTISVRRPPDGVPDYPTLTGQLRGRVVRESRYAGLTLTAAGTTGSGQLPVPLP